MNVLFVSSGNTKQGISPIIKNQGRSLIRQGIEVDFFTIRGKGFWSYFRHIFILRKYLRTNKFDVVHAHYSLTAYVAALAGAKPLVSSLMGSDVKSHKYASILIPFFFKHFWNQTIVKSSEMYQHLNLKEIKIIPNGVDIDRFNCNNKKDCQLKLGWDIKKRHILFAADTNRPEKNFILAQRAINLIITDFDVTLHILKDIPDREIPDYINATDVLILSSLYEGSPNIIKEAMACNCPIVSTNVGDVNWVIGNTNGCFITGFEPQDVAEKIKNALEFGQRTNGRDRIIELGLDSETIALKLIEMYNKILKLQS
jgi:teichuronic acid biosynthesis glycosyltransferase TuaC